jgi:hypothetical protein
MTSKFITVGIGVYRSRNAAVNWVSSSHYRVALKTRFHYLVSRVGHVFLIEMEFGRRHSF